MSQEILVRIEPGPEGVDLVLARGRGNALTTAGLAELERAFESLRAKGAPPLVLRSAGRSFCTGLDLEFAAALDRAPMEALMTAFHRTLGACAAYPGPVVAAIGGPALAGGALLALACDTRIGAVGHARFGVHGVRLGVSYPQVAIEIARAQLGERGAEQLLYGGHLLDATDACRAGWLDALVPATELVEVARRQSSALADPDPRSFGGLKTRIRAPWVARLEAIDRAGMDAWLDQWFSEGTRVRLARARHERAERRGEGPSAPGTPGGGRP